MAPNHYSDGEGSKVRRRPDPARVHMLTVTRRVPSPSLDDPSDDDLLRYLDGDMDDGERALFEAKALGSPYAIARLQILADALAETGEV